MSEVEYLKLKVQLLEEQVEFYKNELGKYDGYVKLALNKASSQSSSNKKVGEPVLENMISLSESMEKNLKKMNDEKIKETFEIVSKTNASIIDCLKLMVEGATIIYVKRNSIIKYRESDKIVTTTMTEFSQLICDVLHKKCAPVIRKLNENVLDDENEHQLDINRCKNLRILMDRKLQLDMTERLIKIII